MRRNVRFLLRPTSRQAAALDAMLEDHRILYNAALEERRAAYRSHGVTVRYGDQSAQLKHIRREDPEGQGRWSFSSQQATLRRLNRAFESFFRRIKSGKTPDYPRFKGRGRFDVVTWPEDGDGCRWDSSDDGPTRVRLQGIGHVRVHQHRAVPGRIKTLMVHRSHGKWYLIISCDDVPVEPLQRTGAVTGIDLGLKSLLTTSEGEHVGNPEFTRANAERLAAAQRRAERCSRGSRRQKKAYQQVGVLHERVARQRRDHLSKVALELVRRYDLICVEQLNVQGMTRSASGTIEEPGTNVAQKAGLNRSILDAGWGVFLSILTAKAESAGRELVAVNPRNTSRTCPDCGHVAGENRVTQAVFRCVRCDHTGHADQVGALNVLRAGLALREAFAA